MPAVKTIFLCCLYFFCLFGCRLIDEPSKRSSAGTLIVTPVSTYTTDKGRNLGEKYQQNLDRVVEEIVQSPVTGRLQFANNVVGLGGIGFFTHSATKSSDERYLEVILGMPDVLDDKMDFNSKIDWIFSQYGFELLSILSSDREIYQDRNVSGYGLNFSWRRSSQAAPGPRVTLESGVIYIPKEGVQRFLARQISQETLLGGSAIFAIQGEGPARLVRYFHQAPKATAEVEAGKVSTQVPPVESKSSAMPSLHEEKSPERESEAKASPPERVPSVSTKPQAKREGMKGYIVQFILPDRADAERLSQVLSRQGYNTSMGAEEENRPVLLRVGNFPSHAVAMKFLDQLRQQGVSRGVVLQVSK